MNDILNEKDFGLKIYNRFPKCYQEEDIYQNYSLKRYLGALAEGGYKPIIEDINRLNNLINSDKIDLKYLDILYAQYGFDMSLIRDMPETFLRKFLLQLGVAYQKKGSTDIIEFVSSTISGIKTKVETSSEDNVSIKLEMDYSLGNNFPEASQLLKLIREFTPFYLTLALLYQYVYTESADLKGVDEEYMRITERLNGNAYIVRNNDTDVLVDNFRHLTEEINRFKYIESESDSFRTINLLLQKIVCEDLLVDKNNNKIVDQKNVGAEDRYFTTVKDLVIENPNVRLSDDVGNSNFLILGVMGSKISEAILSAPSTYDVIKRGRESRLCFYSDYSYIQQ